MRLEQLSYFVEVSRSRSFSLAASRLYMSQQNISTGIRKLEEELGFKLFERTPQGVVLTPSGKDVLAQAEDILRRVDDLKLLRHPHEKQLTGELRLDLVPYIALPEMIIEFYTHNPAAAIKTTEKSPPEIIANVQEGSTDVGFIYVREDERIKASGLKQERIAEEQLFFCVSKKLDYPQRLYTEALLLEEQMPLIVFNCLYDWTMEILAGTGGKKPRVYRADTQLYRKMILEGLAMGFATSTGIEQEIIFKKDEVDAFAIEDYFLSVCMLYKKSPTSPLKERFLALTRERFLR